MVAVLLLQTVHGDTEQLVRNPRARQYPAPSSQHPAPSSQYPAPSFTAFTPITKAKPVSQYQPAAPPLTHLCDVSGNIFCNKLLRSSGGCLTQVFVCSCFNK